MKVRYITNSMRGLPPIENKFGCLTALLKKVLVEGYNEQDIKGTSVSEGVTTVSLKGDHGFLPSQVVTINSKDYRVSGVSYNSISIKTTDTLSGKIKGAPLGFTQVFSDDKATCFKSAAGHILKVIDSQPTGYGANWIKYARVVGGWKIDSSGNFVDNIKVPRHSNAKYENIEMTPVDNIAGWLKWDYFGHESQGGYGENSVTNRGGTSNWTLVGDDKTFYLFINAGSPGEYPNTCIFGSISDVDTFILVGSERFTDWSRGDNRNTANVWRNLFSYVGGDDVYVGPFISNDSAGSYLPATNFSPRALNYGTERNVANARTQDTVISEALVQEGTALRGFLRGLRFVQSDHSIPMVTEDYVIVLASRYDTSYYKSVYISYYFPLEDW